MIYIRLCLCLCRTKLQVLVVLRAVPQPRNKRSRTWDTCPDVLSTVTKEPIIPGAVGALLYYLLVTTLTSHHESIV